MVGGKRGREKGKERETARRKVRGKRVRVEGRRKGNWQEGRREEGKRGRKAKKGRRERLVGGNREDYRREGM